MSKEIANKTVTSDELVAYTSQFLKGVGGEIALPKNYDAVGAVKSFHLALLETKDKTGKPALEVCSKVSIYKAVLELVTKGLDVRKKQAYPIVYGNQLQLQVGYFGVQKLAKTYNPELGDFHAQIILKDDEYETAILPDGRKELVKHVQKFGSDRGLANIIGAYSVVKIGENSAGEPLYDLEDIQIEQIKQSWAKSKTSGQTHREFPEEMCKKTVVSRHAKRLINSTDDSAIVNENQGRIIEVESEQVISLDDDNSTVVTEVEATEVEPDKMPEVEAFDEKPSDTLTVSYTDWINVHKATGKWEQVKDSFDSNAKTVQIRRKS